MKIKHLLIAAAAALFALSSCDKNGTTDLGDPKIDLSVTSMEFDTKADSKSMTVTSTRAWKTKNVPDWVSITPDSGEASANAQTVAVTVLDNTEKDRNVTIEFTCGIEKAYLRINQKGPGGEDTGIRTVAEVIAEANESATYKLHGTVVKFNSAYCSFDLKDETGSIYVYSVTEETKQEYSSKLANGDIVTISGKYKWFEKNQQHEITEAEILEWTKGAGSDAKNATIAEVISEANDAQLYHLEGTVSNFKSGTNTSGKVWYQFDLNDNSGSILVYSFTNIEEWLDKGIKKTGSIVVLEGYYTFYDSKSQHEIVNAKIISVTEGQAADPVDISIADFMNVAEGGNYRLVGTITDRINTQYGNFNITDGTNTVYVYGASNHAEFDSKIVAGNTATVVGAKKNYVKDGVTTIELTPATIEKIEGGSDVPPSPVDEPTTWETVTIAQFISKPVNETDWYELTGTITSIAKASFGNFYIEDETGNLYVYGMTSKWVGSNDQSFSQIGLEVGDKVTFRTLRSEYQGTAQAGGSNIPAYYISHEKGAKPEYPAGTVTLTFPDDNKANNEVSGYDKPWTAKTGNYSFTMTAFNNNKWGGEWTFVRCGRKNEASVASIEGAIDVKVSRVEVVINSIYAADVNEIYMEVGGSKVSATPATGTLTFAVPAPAAGLSYKIVFDCKASTQSTKKNGFVEVSKVIFVAAE